MKWIIILQLLIAISFLITEFYLLLVIDSGGYGFYFFITGQVEGISGILGLNIGSTKQNETKYFVISWKINFLVYLICGITHIILFKERFLEFVIPIICIHGYLLMAVYSNYV